MLSFLLISLAIAGSTFAAPTKRASCATPGAKMDLPPGQTALAEPMDDPSFIGLGVGYQNYTCGAMGKYTSTGAVAEIFDLSCIFGTSTFDDIQPTVFDNWSAAPTCDILEDDGDCFKVLPNTLGPHFFISNPFSRIEGDISPLWNFTASTGNEDAFVISAKTAGLPAPTGKADVDWLQLRTVLGGLAATVYRVDTKGGQPPATCAQGDPDVSVKYTANYFFFGGSVGPQ